MLIKIELTQSDPHPHSLNPSPVLAFSPALSSGLEIAEGARATIEQIPQRFNDMICDGFGVEESVTALVEAVLAG